jgi:hypothetical protein
VTTLVELCAGSAAVALRWLSSTAVPPVPYQGGKRAYADAILVALGLQPGGGARGGAVVLVEAGPWAEAWAEWCTPAGQGHTIERLREWSELDPRRLWDRLVADPVPSGRAERVAAWAVLQWWSFGRKPITSRPGEDFSTWRTHGFDNVGAYRSEVAAAKRAGGEDYDIGRDQLLPLLVERLEALPDLSRVEVIAGDARAVAPIAGAVVLIDPPYDGTTCVYQHDLPRSDVVEIASRWRADGCVVAVCEAEPLSLDGWHAHELPRPVGRGRTFSKQQREVLTLSRPAMGQMRLLGAGC